MSAATPPASGPVPGHVPGPPLHVIGIGADGWDGLAEGVRERVRGAAVVLGGRRQLELLPDEVTGRRVRWPVPLRPGLPGLLASLAETHGPVVALGSGDPLVSGIGTTLLGLLGAERVTVEPAVSSVALARAAMGWPAESCAVVSVVGRDVSLVARELAPGRRILVLSSDEHTPAVLAELLVARGYGGSRLSVLSDLGSTAAGRSDCVASDCSGLFPRLNIVAVDAIGTSDYASWSAGLPDDAFEHDGQLTKRDLRASALARLAPTPGAHLWDVGAGAGSVGIEWMRAHPTCTATAIEADAERAARIGRNARTLGVPGLDIVLGRAPGALHGLPEPDAIFIGGGATRAGVIDACLAALRPGVRIVVHGVTLETEQLLATLHKEHGGELTRICVETAAPVGTFTGWTPARTVTQWSLA